MGISSILTETKLRSSSGRNGKDEDGGEEAVEEIPEPWEEGPGKVVLEKAGKRCVKKQYF